MKAGRSCECDDGRQVTLVDGTVVPRVPSSYKLLGIQMAALPDPTGFYRFEWSLTVSLDREATSILETVSWSRTFHWICPT